MGKPLSSENVSSDLMALFEMAIYKQLFLQIFQGVHTSYVAGWEIGKQSTEKRQGCTSPKLQIRYSRPIFSLEDDKKKSRVARVGLWNIKRQLSLNKLGLRNGVSTECREVSLGVSQGKDVGFPL